MTDEYQEKWVLQYKLIYSCIVAGKSAKFAETVMDKLFPETNTLPFDLILTWGKHGVLLDILKEARTGNYTKLGHCLSQIIQLDPATCTIEDLEAIRGIGPKTSRFFMLWTRENAQYAALDTHVLKFLRELGYNAPKSTPTGKKYRELEKVFLEEAARRGKTPRELDAEVWNSYSNWEDKVK